MAANPLLMIIGIVSAVLIVAIVVIGVIVTWKRKRKQTAEHINASVELSATNGSIVTGIEIQHQIGGGNFGEVYRGLWQATTVVALKKLKGVEQLKEFEAEANTLK